MHRRHHGDRRTTNDLGRAAAGVGVAFLIAALAACGSDSDSTPTDQPAATDGALDATSAGADAPTDPATTDGSGDSGAPADPGDPVAAAPVLVPTVTFALENPDSVRSVAMAPDGAQVAVVTQAQLGDPITITLHDAASGEAVDSTQVDGIGIFSLEWMADGRLVAYADREADPVWRSWDAATLDELPSVPLDFTCYAGKVDRSTGIVYASDDLIGMGDDLCRFDTADGSVTRTAPGVLISPEAFWLAPGSGGVAVLHGPDPDGGSELVVLDGDSLAPVSSASFEQGDVVQAVGATSWISSFDGVGRLEPGAIPVPALSPDPNPAGTVFVAAGDGTTVFVSAIDGSVIGTVQGAPTFKEDWSLDDSSYVRVTLDGQAEIYQF